MELLDRIKGAKEYIMNIQNKNFDLAVILGTGLGKMAEDIENPIKINYEEIPDFPVSTVLGHAGELIIGELMGKNIIAMNGRFHYYEGNTMEKVTFAIRVFKALGINDIIISNAAGGMNPDFRAGDLMIISDHINLMGTNPLIGKNYEELGPRFPDMSSAYNIEMINIAKASAKKLNIKVQKGIYVGVTGPSFETPAELKMLRIIGGDAVGMSTVPEVIAANHMGMRVLGISCITDMAIADNLSPLDHEQVIKTAEKSMNTFISLVKEVISSL